MSIIIYHQNIGDENFDVVKMSHPDDLHVFIPEDKEILSFSLYFYFPYVYMMLITENMIEH